MVAGTACGDSNSSSCTAPDTCDGAGSCDTNDEAAGTTCGDATNGACTDPDTCDGAGTCETNNEVAGTVCGDASSACLVPDTCDSSGACTDNGFEPVSTACGSSTLDECTDPDTCDGAGVCEANDQPDGTACEDGDDPADAEQCRGGICNPEAEDFIAVCNHHCPSRIRLIRNPAKLDFFYLKAGFNPPGGATYDPVSCEFEIQLSNSSGVIYSGGLAAGELPKKRTRWLYKDRTARINPGSNDGISLVQMAPRPAGYWRFQFKAFANLDAANEETMTLRMTTCGTSYELTTDWRQRSSGFTLDLRTAIPR